MELVKIYAMTLTTFGMVNCRQIVCLVLSGPAVRTLTTREIVIHESSFSAFLFSILLWFTFKVKRETEET